MNRVAILTPQFFQFSGKRCLFGGGERYLIDLAILIESMGYNVDVFQPAISNWKKSYKGIKIFGITKGKVDKDFYIGVNKSFYEITKNYDYHIYFNMDMIYPMVFENSICISHGIWWDSKERDWWRTESWYEHMFTGLDNISLLVSVDTNTINWINAVKPDLKCKKTYIPNYVDLNMFKADKTKNNDDNIRILFPRRLCTARGWELCTELAMELTEEYDNFIFSFIGRGGNENSEIFMEHLSEKNNQIKYKWYEMNDMHNAYKNADIVLIPSLYSEGTSFSLLEAMACGKPVIAGLVGGLTDLVLQGYNGYLIEVSKGSLKNAVIELANNHNLRAEMGNNARMVAEKFSKEIWEKRWKKIISEQFSNLI